MNKNNINEIIKEEINNLLKENAIKEGFAVTLQDEELTEGVTYLHQKDTGLPCDIIVDCGKTYEYYNHPLCLYMVRENKVKPVVISKDVTPSIETPNEIVEFIKDNYDVLCAFANMEIDGPDFYDIIESYKNKASYYYSTCIVEMSNFGPDKTGLPI